MDIDGSQTDQAYKNWRQYIAQQAEQAPAFKTGPGHFDNLYTHEMWSRLSPNVQQNPKLLKQLEMEQLKLQHGEQDVQTFQNNLQMLDNQFRQQTGQSLWK